MRINFYWIADDVNLLNKKVGLLCGVVELAWLTVVIVIDWT